MIPMQFQYPPKIGWCTKHNSTTVCKDCEIEALREDNKRYREALTKALDYVSNGCHIVQAVYVMKEALNAKTNTNDP